MGCLGRPAGGPGADFPIAKVRLRDVDSLCETGHSVPSLLEFRKAPGKVGNEWFDLGRAIEKAHPRALV